MKPSWKVKQKPWAMKAYAYAEEVAAKLGVSEKLVDWSFDLGTPIGALGVCEYVQTTIFIEERAAFYPWSSVAETIIHEITHAVLPRGNGHNGYFKAALARNRFIVSPLPEGYLSPGR